ncbi:tyrosine--tRNA ligase [Conexibacter sp. CPCC 206217]|uniref:tyrosine--tRNA ligase n=1 Tax=Conexibacter sp. CPCC 206217 TaxID=3064574 RepID=UPI002724FF83|nr:tyrosine--tRNA ligase [Conexibacter sp. CPCC 206217]MDO8212924.1 tyrosine--tRNA ligase [Conexibacter sp. CPCC 206217]
MALQTSTPAATAAWLARNAVDCLPEGGLQRKLELAEREGRPLRVKLGIDPTAPDIHLGFTVVLGKLREFQDLGHTVVLIVGDYTARVGDPSGRSSTRPILSGEQIDANARTFQQQALKVLDPDRLEVRRNGEWLDMRTEDLFRLTRTTTVARILERDDFAKRYASNTPISILELLYPLLQGYDSVEVDADVELGGTDQKFNLLLGRDIQGDYGKPEQVILTMPILPGIDGVKKMSKSLGNYIGVTEPPEEIYGKTLRLPDPALGTWYELLLGEPPPPDLGPRDAKRALARRLVARFHDDDAAVAAEQQFDQVHREHRPPDEMPDARLDGDGSGHVHLPALLSAAFGVTSSEARRQLRGGGVKLDGSPLSGEPLDRPVSELDGRVLQLGKRRFARLRSN